MKDKNYYETLGVGTHVGSGQIQAAYRFARSLYAGDSTPSYGLLEPAERARMLELVEEAYGTLSNPNSRREYDMALAGSGVAPRSPEAPARPTESRRSEGPRPTFPANRPAEPVPLPTTQASMELLQVPDMVDGPVLKALREKRGLSVDQIAALSKVGGRFLRALEEGRHEALPGRVFARGFLIEYARAIHVSEAEIVERYLRNWTGK
ncbi:MAG: helix-turn-helix domain-containing protein [Vicinamibacteria bacterium]